MIRDYELTDQEFTTVLDALGYAQENAVLGESKAQIDCVKKELMQQFDEQDGRVME